MPTASTRSPRKSKRSVKCIFSRSRSRSRFNFIVPVGKFVLGTVHHCFLNIHKSTTEQKTQPQTQTQSDNQHFNIENMGLDRLKLHLAVLHRNRQYGYLVQVFIALELMDRVLCARVLSSKVLCAKVLCAKVLCAKVLTYLLHIILLHIVHQLNGGWDK